MKALVIADTAPQQPLGQMIEEHQPDLVLTLGDLQAWHLTELREIDLPKMGVYGNHDDATDYFELYNIIDLHQRVYRYRGLRFGGLEGCVRYKMAGRYQYHQDEVLDMLRGFPPVDVMVCHSPPAGVNDHEDDAHRGFMALRQYVVLQKPRMLLHGHTYPEQPLTRFEQTEIRYVHGASILTLPEPLA